MTVPVLVSVSPADMEPSHDPSQWVEWVISKASDHTWSFSISSLYFTAGGGLVWDGSTVSAGWDFESVPADLGAIDGTTSNDEITIRVKPTGGWLANSNYGEGGIGSAVDYISALSIYVLTPGSAAQLLTVTVPLFSTGAAFTGKAAVAGDLSPLEIATGAIAASDAAKDIIASANYVAAWRGATVHVSMGVATLGTVDRPPVDLYFPSSVGGVYTEVAVTRIWLDADVQSVLVGVRCYFAASQSGRVRVTIGGATSVVITADDTDNADEQTSAILATNIGGEGWWDVTIEMERLTGSGSTNAYIRNIRIQDEVIAAADLPDPVDD